MAAEIATSVASDVATKATDSVISFIWRHISYVFTYKSRIIKLKKQVDKLEDKQRRAQVPVDRAERQGDDVYHDVEKWLTRVGRFTEKVKPIIGDGEDKAKSRCFKGLCPNPIKCYQLGKKAVEKANECDELLEEGNRLVTIDVAYRPDLRRMESVINISYQVTVDSRKKNFQDIMEVLKDSKVNMIRVYGMGGVGKTTLIKEVKGKSGKISYLIQWLWLFLYFLQPFLSIRTENKQSKTELLISIPLFSVN